MTLPEDTSQACGVDSQREWDFTFDVSRLLERPALAEGSIHAIRGALKYIQEQGFDPEEVYRQASNWTRKACGEWPDQPHPNYEDVKPV